MILLLVFQCQHTHVQGENEEKLHIGGRKGGRDGGRKEGREGGREGGRESNKYLQWSNLLDKAPAV